MSEIITEVAPAAQVIPDWGNQLADSVKSLTENMTRLVNAANRPQAPAAEPDEPDLDDAALESLPRARFAEHIANKTVKHLQKTVIDPLQRQLREVTDTTTTSQIAVAVEAAKAKHPDFMDYRDQMVSLAKQHPSLAPEDLYTLATSKDTGKRKEQAAGSDDAAKPKPKLKFGGLQPRSGGDATGTRDQKMTATSAATAAWSEVTAALGGEPSFED